MAELLQWLPAPEVEQVAREPRLHDRLGEELADVMLYLLRLADVLGIDLAAAAAEKLRANAGRFAVSEHRGKAPDRL